MARTKAANPARTDGDAPVNGTVVVASPSNGPPEATKELSLEIPSYDPVQINNYNLIELKNTLDDALKRHLSRPDRFTPNHTHTDVRLALGWTGVVVAAATGIYSWKISFEESKLGVFAGVVVYVFLSVVQVGYAYFIERDTVFVGKRKTLAKRIETERLTCSSSTSRPKPKSTAPATFAPSIRTNYPRSSSSYLPPHYKLTMQYALTASGGKSLIRCGKVEDERCYADFFDEKGTLDEHLFVTWLSALVEKVESEQ